MSEYFLKPKSSGVYIKVELDLSKYATKVDSKPGPIDLSQRNVKI